MMFPCVIIYTEAGSASEASYKDWDVFVEHWDTSGLWHLGNSFISVLSDVCPQGNGRKGFVYP